MNEFLNKHLRPTRKLTDQFILTGIIGFALVIIGQLLGALVSRFMRMFIELITEFNASHEFLLQYFSFIGIWIVILLVMVGFKSNRTMLQTLKPHKNRNNFKSILLGLLFGFLLNGFCVFMSWLRKDIQLGFLGIDLPLLFFFLVSVFIQSGAEELTSRSYLYQKLRRRYRNPWLAILFSSSYFVAFHAFNPGVTFLGFAQIFLVALLYAVIIYYYDNLLLCMGMHAGWNYTQSILFGLPNSGIVSDYSLFYLQGASGRNGLFYDPAFGIEGSLGGVILHIIVIAALIYYNRKKKEHTDYWLPLEEELQTKQQETQSAQS